MIGPKITEQEQAQIEVLTRAGHTQTEIARALGLCRASVAAIQKSLGLQPQPFKETRGCLTKCEKRKIARLYRNGLRVREIAERLHVTPNTVALAKKKMGFPVLPIMPEKKILALLQANVDQRQIARILKVPYRRIRLFARAHGFARPRHVLTPAQLAAIDEDILNREGSAKSISKRYKASYRYVLERAHLILECEKFLPTWKWPLSSYFPSRPSPVKFHSEPMSAEEFVERFFHFAPRPGVIVGDHEVGVAAQILLHTRTLFFGRPPNESEYLRGLQQAVAAHLARAATQDSPWTH